MSGYAWFAFFWIFLIALGALEHLFSEPATEEPRWRRWPANLGLGLVNGAIASLLPVTTIWAAKWAHDRGIGVLNVSVAPLWLAAVSTLVLRSLAQYIFHRLAHSVPFLWAVHQVHHSDIDLDASTALRFHPLERVATTLFLLPFVILTGMSPIVLLAYETVELLVGVVSHTSLRIPQRVERAVRWVIVTPGLHRLHHSSDLREADTNYGALFSFWDRAFGTYRQHPLRSGAKMSFGLASAPQHKSDFPALLRMPWRET